MDIASNKNKNKPQTGEVVEYSTSELQMSYDYAVELEADKAEWLSAQYDYDVFGKDNEINEAARKQQEAYNIETDRLRKEHIDPLYKYTQQHCCKYLRAKQLGENETVELYRRLFPQQLTVFLDENAKLREINAKTEKQQRKPLRIYVPSDASTTLPMVLSSINRSFMYEDGVGIKVPIQIKTIWDYVAEYQDNPSVLYSLRTKQGSFPSKASRGMVVAYIRAMMPFLSFGDRRLKTPDGRGNYRAVPLWRIAKNAGYLEKYEDCWEYEDEFTGEIKRTTRTKTRINSSFKHWAERFNATYTLSVQNVNQLFDPSVNSGEAGYQAADRWLHDAFINDLLLSCPTLFSEKELTDLFKAGRKFDKRNEALSMATRIRTFETQFKAAISPENFKSIQVKRKEYSDKIRSFFAMSEAVVKDIATILHTPLVNMTKVAEIRRSELMPDYVKRYIEKPSPVPI